LLRLQSSFQNVSLYSIATTTITAADTVFGTAATVITTTTVATVITTTTMVDLSTAIQVSMVKQVKMLAEPLKARGELIVRAATVVLQLLQAMQLSDQRDALRSIISMLREVDSSNSDSSMQLRISPRRKVFSCLAAAGLFEALRRVLELGVQSLRQCGGHSRIRLGLCALHSIIDFECLSWVTQARAVGLNCTLAAALAAPRLDVGTARIIIHALNKLKFKCTNWQSLTVLLSPRQRRLVAQQCVVDSDM
jgi:hypothetical protein